MEIKNLNLVPQQIGEIGPSAPAKINEDHMQGVENATMDVTGSLRKISRELSELKQDQPDLLAQLEGASWLIAYIADCLDAEIMHAVTRGRKMASEMNGNVELKGQKSFEIMSGEGL